MHHSHDYHFVFFFKCSGAHRDLHSFPTRRSSDLQTDTYIEKDSSINDEINRLRHSATQALLERRDVIIVASVSCIDRKSTRLNSSHMSISYAVFCLKKKKINYAHCRWQTRYSNIR